MVIHLKRTWISLGDFLCQHKYPKYCFGISVVVSTSWCGQFWNEDQHQFLFRETIENILSCYRKRYKNVWIYSATKSVPVYWGHYSIVEVKNPFLLDKLSTEIWNNISLIVSGRVELSDRSDQHAQLGVCFGYGRIWSDDFHQPRAGCKLDQESWKNLHRKLPNATTQL